jgi:tryptophan-rich sensory protein
MERFVPVGVTLLTILSTAVLGKNVKNISDKNNISITPAPFTFIIWFLIYILLLYTTFTHYKEILEIKTQYGSILHLFVLSAVLTALWLYTWGKSLELSSLILVILAIVLIYITKELHKAGAHKSLIYTFGIYAAWVLVACILNLAILFVNKNVLSQDAVKIIAVIILSIIPFLFKNKLSKDAIPILVTFIWASIGIIANKNNNLLFIIPIIASLINITKLAA